MHIVATLRRFADFIDFLGWEELPDNERTSILRTKKLPMLIGNFHMYSDDSLSVTLGIYPRCAYEPGIKEHMPIMDMRLYCEFGSNGKDKIVVGVNKLPYICNGEYIAETVAAFFTTDDTIPYVASKKECSIEFKIDTSKEDPKKTWTDIKNIVELRVNRLNRLEFLSAKADAEMKKTVHKCQLMLEKDFGNQ